jgi:hypothetical protein
MSYAGICTRPASPLVVPFPGTPEEDLREVEPKRCWPLSCPGRNAGGERRRRQWMLGGPVVLAAVLAVRPRGSRWYRQQRRPTQPLIFHTVTPGDSLITVTERGNLRAKTTSRLFAKGRC